MTTVVSHDRAGNPERSPSSSGERVSQRALALADRLEQGARALITFASGLTDAEWQTRVPGDGRKIGVTVHHVASIALEIQLAQTLADGKPIVGVAWDSVHAINAGHAKIDAVTKEAALDLLRQRDESRGGSPGPQRRGSIGRLQCRSTPMPHSRASSSSKITPCGTAITTSPVCGRR
jgi:hypothetical protein